MIIPDKVIERLSLYHYMLDDCPPEDMYISSTKIARLLNIDNSQVRKDIKYLNNSGKCRVGYEVKALKKAIENKLGFSRQVDVFLVGAGNLGSALAKYEGFEHYGLKVLAMFDVDPLKVGNIVNGKKIFPLTKLPDLVKRMNIKVAILTVPRQCAQSAAEYIAAAGIKCIWNFAPCVLDVKPEVKVWNENLIGSFLQFTKDKMFDGEKQE